jgi:hypothetical protein
MLVVLMVTLACVIAALVLRFREPEYGGKPLSFWVHDYEFGKDSRATDEAVRSIGTNGLPVLLAMMEAKDHPAWSNVVRFANQHGLKHLKYIPAEKHHLQAVYAFNALGASASNAVPKLLKMYRCNPCFEPWAGQALGQIGPAASAAVPVFLVNLGNTNTGVREVAAGALGKIHCCAASVVPALMTAMDDPASCVRYQAMLGLALYGEEAKSGAPALLHYLEKGNYPEQAVWALTQVHADPQMVLKVLLEMLHNADFLHRLSGVMGLQAMGKEAQAAIPDLLQMLDEQDLRQDLRQEVIAALKVIDPAAAAKAGVSEKPSAPL